MQQPRKWIIYALKHPETQEIRYVGLTCCAFRKRLLAHLNSAEARRTPCACWLLSLRNAGLLPSHDVLESELQTKQAACDAEQRWIARLRSQGLRLLNSTDGGEGVQNLSPEGRERLAAPTAETLKKRGESISRTMRNNPALIAIATERIRGVRCSPEQVARMSAGNIGRKRSEEAKAKRRATLAAWTPAQRDEFRKRIREGTSQETRDRIAAMLRGRKVTFSPQHLANLRAANIAKAERRKLQHAQD